MKYELDTIVKAKHELVIPATDLETGNEFEIVIPADTEGYIFSQGRSSVYGFKPMYDVIFDVNGEEQDITFLEKDLEESCSFVMNTV